MVSLVGWKTWATLDVSLLLQKLSWTDGSPLSFQLFTNRHYAGFFRFVSIHSSKRACPFHRVHPKQPIISNDMKVTIFPNSRKGKHCVLLLLHNLASPEWVNSYCNRGFTSTVFCRKNNTVTDQHQVKHNKHKHCLPGIFLFQSKCVLIRWTDGQWKSHLVSKRYKMNSLISSNISEFVFVTNNVKITPIVIHNLSCTHIFSFNDFRKQYTMTTVQATQNNSGHQAFVDYPVNIKFGRNVFQCTSGKFISATQVCDKVRDCSDNFDEQNCICSKGDGKKICHRDLLKKVRSLCLVSVSNESNTYCSTELLSSSASKEF